MDVDAIINAIDSDSDDDAALDEMIARFSINVSKTSAERELEQKYAYIGTVVGKNGIIAMVLNVPSFL